MEKLPIRIKQTAARWLMKNRWFSRNIVAARWFLHVQDQSMNSWSEQR
jgi:hypothetical protein